VPFTVFRSLLRGTRKKFAEHRVRTSSIKVKNRRHRIYRSFSSNFLSRFHTSLITWAHGRCRYCGHSRKEISMQMLSRLVQDQSHNAVVEYALIAMLVAATVILRVTMQA
jgi:hypothetical protein